MDILPYFDLVSPILILSTFGTISRGAPGSMNSDSLPNEPNHNDPFGDRGNETKVGLQADRETDGHAHLECPPPWTGGDKLGDFFLERLLGCGSSSWVYLARHCANNERLALKLLRPESPEKMLWNKLGFRRMMSVEHENLVRVDRIYQLGEYVGLAMEHVDGKTFAQARKTLVKLEPSVAYEQLLSTLRQFSAGLAVMHGRGLVHRDMKPANMMIGSDGIAKIIDYGLVDPIQLNAIDCKPRGHILGTPRYIAPEVYWSQRYLPSGDIFCLGVVVLETLIGIQKCVGSVPIDLHRSQEDTEDQQLISDAMTGLQDTVPVAILQTCRQMLARDPAERPRAVELARVGRPRTASLSVPISNAIIGRESELRTMKAWIDRVFSGSIGRMHISGPPGIGKSCLIDELVRYTESKNWGQVFRACCQNGEKQPMQAFDQICDAIAERYMQSDREPLELDPVAATIIKNGFPVLRGVLNAKVNLVGPGSTKAGSDSVAAAVRLSEQLRLVGPLFVVIDDSQWADQDSRNVLDNLAQAAGPEGLGIITVSSESESYRVSPQLTVQLVPLKLDESISLLSRSVGQQQVDLSADDLQKLALASAGNPYRLRAIAVELGRGRSLAINGGSIDAALADHELIDRLGQRRVEKLSDDALSMLPFVVTAGGRMSTAQLSELTGLNESVDAVVSELAQQRLILDEATGDTCIQVTDERIRGELGNLLSESVKQRANSLWASHLARQDNPKLYAARIAGHYFDAGQPGQALSYAILAAEDAELRKANFEAARLYKRVARHVDGTEKISQLQNAARCFREAEYPVEAAECFQELAKLLDENDRIDSQMMAAALLTRAGRTDEVRTLLRELASTLRLPKPKPDPLAMAAVIARQFQLSIHGRGALMTKLVEQAEHPDQQSKQLDRRTKQRLDLCFSIVRPISFFDNLYAAELNMFGSRLLLKHANAQQRIQAAVAEAVFACYDSTQKRVDGENQLKELKKIADKIGSASSKGDVAAGEAISNGLAGRWQDVARLPNESVAHYIRSSDPDGFEIAHTEWIQRWAMWHLGQWKELRKTVNDFYDLAVSCNDRFQQIIAYNGFSVGAWLAADDLKTLEQIQMENYTTVEQLKQFQVVDVFNWTGLTLRKLYNGQYDAAWHDCQLIKPKFGKMPFAKMQIFRVMRNQLAVVTALHQLNLRYGEPLVLRASLLVDQLRKEQTPFPTMLANLYGGLLTQRIASVQNSCPGTREAIRLLATAREEAAKQGLIPFQLAASDALQGLETGTPSIQLIKQMSAEGVVQPLKFQRMFTVDFCS